MTRKAAHFPDCSGDPAALTRTVPAATPALDLTAVPPGNYAISVIHDENDNAKLDTALGIPKEGFGFSRNPKIRFGPPQFRDVVVTSGPGQSHLGIRMKYLL